MPPRLSFLRLNSLTGVAATYVISRRPVSPPLYRIRDQSLTSFGEGQATKAVDAISSSLTTIRLTGTKMYVPWFLMCLSKAHADLGQFDVAWRSISKAMTQIETTGERWCEAEVHRIAGEIALMTPKLAAEKAEEYFERSLAVARQQQAKSWELRASMSLARLWRHQGKVSEARELLAPVYGWFTEGFDTRDLKEAKALLAELVS